VLLGQGVTTRDRAGQAGLAGGAVRTVLVVAPGGGDPDGLFVELSARAEYLVRCVGSPGAAEGELRSWPVALVVASPGVSPGDVGLLLAARERLRPGTPVLVIRRRQAGAPAVWTRRGVGVLRCPLLPGALSRSVDVVLGLAARPEPGRRARR